ncbi:CAP domain-containing protein [Salaquimonas pukyongi]|uniref:CAP domain-containing protein n=1 Tax=Salaquimonas pukyongi TaxID=2712698 RepID=UPI00096B71C7|nr:CAP domain-containing protein [Salaquimonas pukyongi]
MGNRLVRRTGLDVRRRQVIAAGPLMLLSGGALLSGCAKGSSSHAGRRLRTDVHAQPLQFDVKDGFARLNKIRRRRLLPEFQMDGRLQKAAQDYADLMGSRGLYGHEIGPGTDFRTRIFAAGFDNSAGENLGVGYGSIDEAIEGWMDSPDHRKNMLKARYRLAGLGYAFNTSGRNERYTHLWVLIMGAA